MIQFLHLLISVVVLVIILSGDCVTSILTDDGYMCSGGPNSSIRSYIEYPFWSGTTDTVDFPVLLRNHSLLNTTYVGYPGLLVNCEDDGGLTSNLSTTNLYYLRNIVYSGGIGSLTAVDVSVDGQECPQPRHNFSSNEDTFFYVAGYTSEDSFSNYDEKTSPVWIFYNCSSGYPKDTAQHLPCLDNSSRGGGGGGGGGHNFSSSNEGFTVYGYTSNYYVPFYDNKISPVWIFYNCSSGYPEDTVQHLPCLDNSSRGGGGRRSFAFLEEKIPQGFNWYQNCEESVRVPVMTYEIMEPNYAQALRAGFQLSFYPPPTEECWTCQYESDEPGYCVHNKQTNAFVGCICSDGTKFVRNGVCKYALTIGLKIMYGVLLGFGGILLILFLIFRRMVFLFVFRNKNTYKRPTKVETFLETFGNLAIERYTYSSIKKMTNSFKDLIGRGGYGSVFKGKLDDGRFVAVKVLNESKGKGEDFINEVATISRTNHVNVVRLLGFCSDGTKQVLVYEFMANGSLEKFVYNEKKSATTNTSLGWENLYQIALGIARGLEYLHCQCNTRILHFDIKPHNILLDIDFCPKISDFGLAKLCPTRESIVSMFNARGTIGYIAPEVYCRNFGGASHKSDVYSYGMMMLEMIGGRKNIDITVENSSEIYFPQWIYNHLKQNNEVELLREIFQEETTRKMIIISLWCIQTQPINRPSISKVVEMLEGSIEDLEMPPNPFQDDSTGPSIEAS